MTQEDKQLLLVDLCAKLPYAVKVQYNNEIYNIDYISALYEEVKLDIPVNYTIGISEIKPYLRPMSSMTDEENKKLDEIWLKHTIEEGADYLNSIHVDYRGLIEKSLALEAPEGMYKEEQQ